MAHFSRNSNSVLLAELSKGRHSECFVIVVVHDSSPGMTI